MLPGRFVNASVVRSALFYLLGNEAVAHSLFAGFSFSSIVYVIANRSDDHESAIGCCVPGNLDGGMVPRPKSRETSGLVRMFWPRRFANTLT